MSPDLSAYDLEYAELHEFVFDRFTSKLSLRLLCPRANWHWIEKLNTLKRIAGLGSQTPTGVVVALSLTGILDTRGNLPAAIESAATKLPLELDEIELECTAAPTTTLRLSSDSLHLEALGRECALVEIQAVDLRERLRARAATS